MGHTQPPAPVMCLLVAFGRDESSIDWAIQTAAESWGPSVFCSPRFDFNETDYYAPAMGAGLRLTIVAFERLIDPAELPARKRQTNSWEAAYAKDHSGSTERPLNLDPGYLSLAKLVLASTKDHLHRLYLGHGIYGEVTLHFSRGAWQTFPWTYPNYRRADYQQFLLRCRRWLHDQLGQERTV